ncbi:hypothetical protein HBH98_241430 [Parastagonospora nodorum]|nr:hypothetical protein HBH53_246270 [Parastagonospora nodorum]KAH3956043.1 hypothetical protein HBH51_257290 [Parastagonospora nodorum]KAH4215604.1 hypothetical protein HBI06_246280 [Parastagonospora nodorum]KAH4224357.1 hypothetical protein HBI05_239340 [Parastagonospora nodorum]KAH4334384.1 hypothetical protein HBH98_241430 [Parastagonospora nodorum]
MFLIRFAEFWTPSRTAGAFRECVLKNVGGVVLVMGSLRFLEGTQEEACRRGRRDQNAKGYLKDITTRPSSTEL